MFLCFLTIIGISSTNSEDEECDGTDDLKKKNYCMLLVLLISITFFFFFNFLQQV